MLWIRGYGPINGRQSLGRSIAIEKAVLPRHPLQLPDTETNHGGHGTGHDQRCNEREPAHQAYRSLACLSWGACERPSRALCRYSRLNNDALAARSVPTTPTVVSRNQNTT